MSAFFLAYTLQLCVCQPSLPLSATPSSVAVNRENGEVFVAAGSQLLRLSDSLVRIENVTVGGELVQIALSPDGSRLVGCLGGDNRTCLVYSSSDLTSGASARVDNALYRPENGLAIIATNDSFYLGSEGEPFGLTDNEIYLTQYNFSAVAVRTTEGKPFLVQISNFVRHFYGGVSINGYVYYFVADTNPNAIRVLRVCDCARTSCTSGTSFEALYELTLQCRGSVSATTRVCGVDLLESFADRTGPLVVLTQCDSDGTRNRACAFLLSDIDGDMDNYFTDCSSGTVQSFQLPWDTQRQCSQFIVSAITCHPVLMNDSTLLLL